MTEEKQFFTLVFEGDITKWNGNPFKIETPFGFAIAAGLGNAFEELEKLHFRMMNDQEWHE